MICKVPIKSENLTLHMHNVIYDSMYKHAVLTDFVLFKYNYCEKCHQCSKSPMMRFAQIFPPHQYASQLPSTTKSLKIMLNP
ncbi:hypothetical protein TSAR_003066 [Trichomalopsis sarcophagae]|uniref:Uncharacterized protein n=1 Tax=Trichomalopsis sarcophagae TaxID=543379 RepID=A0A232FM02_9HYME|nr:hypothetical protein TSAR_003066 [Trichomalopsis sarcophagae]